MNYTFKFHSDIEKDYSKAYAWYETQKQGLGERFLLAVRKKLDQINRQPEVFSSKGNTKYREAVIDVFPYLIVYKIYKRKQIIFVSSIHHSKKSPSQKYR